MKRTGTLMTMLGALLAVQAEAAVPVSGFTIEQGSQPYGLVFMAIVLAAIGLYSLRSSN